MIISTHAFAEGQADPVKMANQIGFTGCNALIRKTFKLADNVQEKRVNVRYFSEQKKDSIYIDMSYGKIGDAVIQSTHFIRRGGTCYASIQATITQEGTCAGILSRDNNYKYLTESAGVIWAKNAAGMTKLLSQKGNTCTSSYIYDDRQKAQS